MTENNPLQHPEIARESDFPAYSFLPLALEDRPTYQRCLVGLVDISRSEWSTGTNDGRSLKGLLLAHYSHTTKRTAARRVLLFVSLSGSFPFIYLPRSRLPSTMQDIKDAVVDQVDTSTGANDGRPTLSNAADAIQGNRDFASILQEFNIDARTIPSYLNLDLDLDVPTDDDYRPRQFQPIGTTIERFHNIPRGWSNTNDIVALATRFAPNEAAIRNAGDETAKEYVRGIAVVSIAMLLLYVVWGAILLLLRMGRLGEWKCFGRRCCARGVTCVENTRARGGCCARNVCGWMAGRVPKKPTEASLKRDARIKQSSLIKISRRGKGPHMGEAEAEAGAESEGSGSDGNDENKVEPADEIVISEEYLAKRRQREERSMRAIRIGFLFSGAVVLAACVVLCVSGFRAIDNLIISAQESLLSIDEYFAGIIDECDKCIQSTEELSELRRDFLEGLHKCYIHWIL